MTNDFDMGDIKEYCMFCKKHDCRTFHVITRQMEIDVTSLTLDEIQDFEKLFKRDLRTDVFLNAGNGHIIMKVVKYGG